MNFCGEEASDSMLGAASRQRLFPMLGAAGILSPGSRYKMYHLFFYEMYNLRSKRVNRHCTTKTSCRAQDLGRGSCVLNELQSPSTSGGSGVMSSKATATKPKLSKLRTEIVPLPGDRQGVSGAGAGHDSMRDVGGRVLRRRTPVVQAATAPPQQQQLRANQTTATSETIPNSFTRSDIVGDGNCLFRAVSLHLYGHQNHHEKLREVALKYIQRNWSELHTFSLIEGEDMKVFNNYYNYMRKNGTYGTSLEILALSETQNSNFHIFSKQRRTRDTRITFKDRPTLISTKNHTGNIYLLLTGNPMSGHFELLTPQNIENNPNNLTPIREATGERRNGRGRRGNRQLDQNDEDRAIENGPAESVVPANKPKPTKAGKAKQRMSCTIEKNEHVMRCYTKIIKPDTQITENNIRVQDLPKPIPSTTNTDTGQTQPPEPDPPTYVLQGQHATTKAGKPRQRLKWTDEMNRTVMHCYYTATKIETITSGYGLELHRLFLAQYPHLQLLVTEQRVIDQKRVITKNNRLTPLQLQIIKDTVATEMNTDQPKNKNSRVGTEPALHTQQPSRIQEDPQQDPPPSRNSTHNVSQQIATTTQQHITDKRGNHSPRSTTSAQRHIESPLTQTLQAEMESHLAQCLGTDPTTRDPIPRLIFKHNTQKILNTINKHIIPQYITDLSTIEDIHTIIYAAAITTLTQNNQKLPQRQRNPNSKKPKFKWQIRIENKINNIRRDIGHLTQFINGNASKRVTKGVDKIKSKSPNRTLPEILDTLKQKLSVYAARLRRYKESNERKDINNLFQRNEKQFYRKTMYNKQTAVTEPPNKQELTDYWKSIWSEPKLHNNNTPWIKAEEDKHKHVTEQENSTLTTQELTDTIKHTHNWKCPGIDNIQNFWYKQFTTTHEALTHQINKAILQPHTFPTFLTQGITYVKPKSSDTTNPSNYRPITCLPTLYKIITAAISKKIEQHLIHNNILTEEQKGCRKNSRGCKEQLIIDSVIMGQTRKEHRNLHTCYIDYKKAFDSIPHSWLIRALEIYKVNQNLRQFLAQIMKTWRTKIHLNTQTERIQTEELHIKRGIFQGDSLSALWFCLCLNPLSNTLNRTDHGFCIRHQKVNQHRINHLLYMDDIKLYAATETQLKELLKITETFTLDINMEFGMNKCKVLHINKGQWKCHHETEIINNETLDNMLDKETYKYLGFHQSTKLNHTHIKTELKTEFSNRLTKLLQTKLNSKNLTKAINTLAVPILTYSFGIIKWSQTDIENIHILIRSQFTKYRKLHPNACKERLTIERKEGGRGIIDIRSLHTKQIQALRKFFHTKQTSLHTATVKADKNYTPLDLSQANHPADTHSHTQLQQEKMKTWSEKTLHGKHRYHIEQDCVNKKQSYTWLQDGQLFPETEGFLLAIQDKVILTRNYQKHIIKDPTITEDRCRKCHQHKETIEHITSGCKILAGTEYTARHNSAAKVVHQALATTYELIENTDPYYKYTPTTILENKDYKLYWDITIHTDKTVPANRPDITFQDKKGKITYLIDIAVPNDTNIQTKYTEKISKYIDLATEIKRLWKQEKVIIVPLVISATGLTPTTFTPHLEQLGLNTHIHKNIQKSVILKTCNIVRSFLNTPG